MTTPKKRRPAQAKSRTARPSDALPVLYCRVPQDVHDRIGVLAAADERTVTAWLTRLVRSLGDDGQTMGAAALSALHSGESSRKRGAK